MKRLGVCVLSGLVCAASVPAFAASIAIEREGSRLEAVIPAAGSTGYRASLSPDGLVGTIQLDAIKDVPDLADRAQWPDPIATVLMSRAGDGARLTIIARRPMRLGGSPLAHDGAITVAFDVAAIGQIAERPIAPAPRWTQGTALPAPNPLKLAMKAEAKPKPPAGMPVQDPTFLAALHGDAHAQLELGTMCLSPESPDPSCARFWFERSALLGNEIAAYNLGRFAAKGIAGPTDDAEAAHWFQLAADRGYPEAEYALALLMLEGRGTPQDIARAQELLQKAGLKGHGRARRLLDDLRLQLSATAN